MIFTLSGYNKRAMYGGIVAAVIIGLGAFVLGSLSGYQAKILLKNSLPGFNTLSNTIVLASATILALLLTLLSVSTGAENKLKDDHYKQVLRIAKIDTSVFIAALICFQLFNIPITESDSVPTTWFSVIYYSIMVISAILSGALITVAIMLYNAIVNIINIVGLGNE
jgi:MFS family permease